MARLSRGLLLAVAGSAVGIRYRRRLRRYVRGTFSPVITISFSHTSYVLLDFVPSSHLEFGHLFSPELCPFVPARSRISLAEAPTLPGML